MRCGRAQVTAMRLAAARAQQAQVLNAQLQAQAAAQAHANRANLLAGAVIADLPLGGFPADHLPLTGLFTHHRMCLLDHGCCAQHTHDSGNTACTMCIHDRHLFLRYNSGSLHMVYLCKSAARKIFPSVGAPDRAAAARAPQGSPRRSWQC